MFHYMLTNYLDAQLQKASYKILEDQTYFGEISGLEGVWANAPTLEACRNELRDVLESWIFVKLRHQEEIDGLTSSKDSDEHKTYA